MIVYVVISVNLAGFVIMAKKHQPLTLAFLGPG